jgi:hypothetical protein
MSRTAERGQGGKLPRAPRFWRPLEIFCWAPVIFLGEIFPRKGQDICVFLDKVPKFGMKN